MNIRDTLKQRCPYAYGIEHPDGWNDILEMLHYALLQTDPDYQVLQTKQKFGGLRFYTSPLSDKGKRFVILAERAASRTCEDCGNYAELDKSHHWYATLCDHCRAARDEADRKFMEHYEKPDGVKDA